MPKVFTVFKNVSMVLLKMRQIKKMAYLVYFIIFVTFSLLHYLLIVDRFSRYKKCIEKRLEFIFAIIESKHIDNEDFFYLKKNYLKTYLPRSSKLLGEKYSLSQQLIITQITEGKI